MSELTFMGSSLSKPVFEAAVYVNLQMRSGDRASCSSCCATIAERHADSCPFMVLVAEADAAVEAQEKLDAVLGLVRAWRESVAHANCLCEQCATYRVCADELERILTGGAEQQ